MEIELLPLNIISSDDQISKDIMKYIIKSMHIPTLNDVQYLYTLSDEDDDIIYIVSGYKKPYRKKGITTIKNAMKCVVCKNDNFQKVFGEIAFIARLLMMVNIEQRKKYKKIPKIVDQSIKLYAEISPENYKIYSANAFPKVLQCFAYRALIVIILLLILIWLLGIICILVATKN